ECLIADAKFRKVEECCWWWKERKREKETLVIAAMITGTREKARGDDGDQMEDNTKRASTNYNHEPFRVFRMYRKVGCESFWNIRAVLKTNCFCATGFGTWTKTLCTYKKFASESGIAISNKIYAVTDLVHTIQ
ncbi:12871_t:CDS:2, partial [Acaulospora morrowiae]